MAIQVCQIGALDLSPFNIIIETGDCTVEALLSKASEKTGIDLVGALFDDGTVKEGIVILANGYSITAQKGLETVVNDGTQMLITTLIFGG